jgi:hypothetical protein
MKESTSNKMLNRNNFQIYRLIKLFAIGCLLCMAGCTAKKQVLVTRKAIDTTNSGNTAAKVNPVIAKLEIIKGRQIFFNTFTAKAKAKLDMDGSSNDVTLNIRINRDKKIWVSVTAIAGIEVARAVITPDSVLLINRLQSVYIREPFSYIHSFTGNQVNYKTLESLLMGNAIPELLNENSVLQTDNGNTTLTGNLQELVYKLILGPDMKVTQTNLDNQSAAQSLQVTNNTFIQAANKVIPSQIDIASLVKDKKIELNLHYSKVEFDKEQDYPFSIPARYKREN